ncbi:MAG TPA: hypothetical protein VE986_00450, partial [Hyphomicrobiales bacterium]|nr:hypothetical protein [Hyphomicrobiales bacterium]
AIIAAGGSRGEIYRRLAALRDRYANLIRRNYPKIPRRVSGYNLDNLLPENGFNVARALVGSEGTCVAILEATLNLVHSPPYRCVAVIGFPDIYRAGDAPLSSEIKARSALRPWMTSSSNLCARNTKTQKPSNFCRRAAAG